jgi:hypothetical protein
MKTRGLRIQALNESRLQKIDQLSTEVGIQAEMKQSNNKLEVILKYARDEGY